MKPCSTSLALELLPIEQDGYHLLVKGRINGKKANFLVDTGASRTVFDEKEIMPYLNNASFEDNEKLSTGLGTSEMPSMVTVIENIRFGRLNIKEYPSVIIDLSNVHKSYDLLGLPRIVGVLGGDLLYQYQCRIDYSKMRIRFFYVPTP
ncbi:MAG TPA: retropepsin-like aspartic protease [Bacteroidales bacterium]|mgnify:CR=1 FL=1|nr:retropepsin-like aspartic protease [Bacteroidales bacterium]